MLLGTNVNSSQSYEVANKFISELKIDFVEILVDNFLHLDPAVALRELKNTEVAIHIMSSNFLTASKDSLADFGKRVRRWIEYTTPIYVSDHLILGNIAGRNLEPAEQYPYSENPETFNRIADWRNLLNSEIILENFAPSISGGMLQSHYINLVVREKLAGCLFDVSNAVVGDLNNVEPFDSWLDIARASVNYHISGYRPARLDASFISDSHDTQVSEVSWAKFGGLVNDYGLPETLVIERDSNRNTLRIDIDFAQGWRG